MIRKRSCDTFIFINNRR